MVETSLAAPDPDLLIDFHKVSLRRGGRTLVGPVTWSVELDERWVVIGPNGAGKTSLLRIAAAMEYPSSGTAYVLGERLGRVDMSELRSRVGLSSSALSQRVPDGEIVRDLVVSAGYAVLGRWREAYDDIDYERAIDTLESVGAEHLADRTYDTLSEGERKRVLIARSLMTDPELLLLDEPAAGLDLGGREELVARLADLAADPDAPAIVLVTHHVEEIPQGFSHCLVLSEGASGRRRPAARCADRREPVQGVRPVHRAGRDRRAVLRQADPQPCRTQETPVSDQMTPRPAATVMLLRDAPDGLEVFLLQRHSRMDFAPGTTVFPGGGVDDRDREADIAWTGPDPSLVGAAAGRRRGAGAGAGVRRGARDVRGVRSAARRARRGQHRQRRNGLPRCASNSWRVGNWRSATSCAARVWCCAPTCCGRGPTG